VRRFLSKHEVRTCVEIEWHPQLENGELLNAPETRPGRARVQYLARGA